MKRQNIAKSIVVQLLLVNMILILGCPSKPNGKKADDNSPKNFYEMTEEKITVKDALGTKLPKTATIVNGFIKFNGTTRVFWLVAEMDELDFEQIVQDLEMYNDMTLLDVYPDLLECNSEQVSSDWNLTKEIDAYTFYCDLKDYEGYRIAKYENNKLYFKRFEFFDIVKNDQNEDEYIKRVRKK